MSDSTDRANRPDLLVVQNVAKSYGRIKVLRDVSLTVPPGAIVGITGENGSGKSTLLNIIVGRLKADAGRLERHARTGYCPQELLIFETLTVEENLTYFSAAYGLNRRDQCGVRNAECGIRNPEARPWQDTARGLLQRFGFEQYRRTPVSQLSGGTKQKLNLIVAFLHGPELLVLDEPYSGFDWETYLQFWEFAREERRQGRSFLIVSHLVYDRTQLDSVYRLKNGILECA